MNELAKEKEMKRNDSTRDEERLNFKSVNGRFQVYILLYCETISFGYLYSVAFFKSQSMEMGNV